MLPKRLTFAPLLSQSSISFNAPSTSIPCVHGAHSDTILQAVTYYVAINSFCECFEKRPRFRFWDIDSLDRHAHLSRGSEYAMRHALHRIVPELLEQNGRIISAKLKRHTFYRLCCLCHYPTRIPYSRHA